MINALRLRGGCSGEIEQVENNVFLTVKIRNRFIRKVHLLLLVKKEVLNIFENNLYLTGESSINWININWYNVHGPSGRLAVPEQKKRILHFIRSFCKFNIFVFETILISF